MRDYFQQIIQQPTGDFSMFSMHAGVHAGVATEKFYFTTDLLNNFLRIHVRKIFD